MPSSLAAMASNRTLLMAALAAVLAVLTYIDQTHTGAKKGEGGPVANSGAVTARVDKGGFFAEVQAAGETWREIRKLETYAANSDLIRNRYQSVSVPYSEAVASLAGLHYRDESPAEAADRNIRAALPKGVDIAALMISRATVASGSNANVLTAKLSLESMDSKAMLAALLSLGDPETGKRWLDLAFSADETKRKMFVTGTLEILSLEAAE